MAGANCTIHFDRPAAGNCSRCGKPYCADCLDFETGQAICPECKKAKGHAAPPASAPAPAKAPAPMPGMGGSPLNFKGKGLDDDPLGLLGGGPSSPPMPKMEPPKPSTPQVDIPLMSPGHSMGLPPVSPAPAAPKPAPSPAPAPAGPKPSLDLDGLMNEPQPLRPPFPKAPGAPLSPAAPAPGQSGAPLFGETAPSSAPFPSPMPGVAPSPAAKGKQKLGLIKAWAKYLLRRPYEMFDPWAKKLKVPTYVLVGGLVLAVVGVLIGILSIVNRPTVPLVRTIPPIHIVMVNAAQVSELDVTTFTDLEAQLQKMGFTPLIQMTIPQLPATNFFDVADKDDAGTYSEILKMPGDITPHLSFVTVFTNGVWFSTNGWNGKNQNLDYLISEFYPGASPDDLYLKHKQAVDKFKADKDWQPQLMNVDRYMAALSDHLRWYLTENNLQGYQADFKSWH